MIKKSWNTRAFAMATVAIAMLLTCIFSCNGNDSEDKDTDSNIDSDADTDSDIDSDADTDTDVFGVCLASITGILTYSDGEKITDQDKAIKICWPNCSDVATDGDGRFRMEFPFDKGRNCHEYDFTKELQYIHLTIQAFEEDLVVYVVSLKPSQKEISDKGPDDLELDVGTITVYKLSSNGVNYTAKKGVTVDIDGLSFTVEPNGLLTKELDKSDPENPRIIEAPVESAIFNVFKSPKEWTPPFDVLEMDALYFIAPYWGLIADAGVVLTMVPPDNWVEGDTGTLFMLGDYNKGIDEPGQAYIYQSDKDTCSANGKSKNQVEPGYLASCGQATYKDGKVTTAPIPRFGWVGIKK